MHAGKQEEKGKYATMELHAAGGEYYTAKNRGLLSVDCTRYVQTALVVEVDRASQGQTTQKAWHYCTYSSIYLQVL